MHLLRVYTGTTLWSAFRLAFIGPADIYCWRERRSHNARKATLRVYERMGFVLIPFYNAQLYSLSRVYVINKRANAWRNYNDLQCPALTFQGRILQHQIHVSLRYVRCELVLKYVNVSAAKCTTFSSDSLQYDTDAKREYDMKIQLL